jgi:hypothetical protein
MEMAVAVARLAIEMVAAEAGIARRVVPIAVQVERQPALLT